MPEPGSPAPLHLVSWKSSAVVAVALVAMAAGFGQFGAVAALGDVATAFGHQSHGGTLADQAGLSGTIVGVGLAVIRLASLGALFLTALADRFGRRRVLLLTCAGGLVCTLAAAVSPGYWWFVAIFALGRPLLSATNGVAQVSAAELTASKDRAKAVALIAAGYGVGAGLLAIVHSLGEGTLGFRGLFALVVVPLFALPLLSRRVVETDRFTTTAARQGRQPVFVWVARPHRRRLLIVCVLTFTIAVMTGPANSFVFFYAQNVRHLSGAVTAAMVAAGGVTGLAGLLAGRWLADHWGRRPTVALSMLAIACAAILTYSGSDAALLCGYGLGVLSGSVFAPAGGALANEMFPTEVRASVAGWYVIAAVLGAVVGLLVFGAVADIGNRFSVAAVVTFVPAVPFAALLLLLPETKGLEPEQLWGTGAR
jgi:MFS family permease